MRAYLPEELERARVRNHFGSDDGLNGRFILQGPSGSKLHLISYDGKSSGWEQVSIATDRKRCPNWPEMCFAKDLFWEEEECVVQYHPPLSQYVKNNRYCLHLWKPRDSFMPAPPANLVGIVGLGPHEAKLLIDDFVKAWVEQNAIR